MKGNNKVILFFIIGVTVFCSYINISNYCNSDYSSLKNIEALAEDEGEDGRLAICIGTGKVDCPEDKYTADKVLYL